jgi:hypothetical protein
LPFWAAVHCLCRDSDVFYSLAFVISRCPARWVRFRVSERKERAITSCCGAAKLTLNNVSARGHTEATPLQSIHSSFWQTRLQRGALRCDGRRPTLQLASASLALPSPFYCRHSVAYQSSTAAPYVVRALACQAQRPRDGKLETGFDIEGSACVLGNLRTGIPIGMGINDQ